MLWSILVGTGAVLVTNALMAGALTGLGLVLRRAFCGRVAARDACADDVFLAFWMGYGGVILFLMLWNYVFPVNPAALVAVVVTGLTALYFSWPPLSFPRRGVALVGALFALWVAHLSTGAMTQWDSALYHMQGVRWAREFPVVPGVANLLGPMGFNNASLLYDAMMDAGFFRQRAWHVSNGVLVTMMGLQIVARAWPLFDRAALISPSSFFALVLLAPVVNFAMSGRVASFTTVEPASLLIFAVVLALYRTLSDPPRPARARLYDVFAAVALAAVSVSVKSSAAAFAAGVVVVAWAVGWHSEDVKLRPRLFGWASAAASLVAAAWVGRGILLSGYVLFPSPLLSVPVEWRVPYEHARAELAYVVHSAWGTAWTPGYVTGDVARLPHWSWIWFKTLVEDGYDVAAPIAVLLVALSVVIWSEARGRRHRPGAEVWLLVPLGAAVVGWLLTAPMSYYATPFLWALAALVAVHALLTIRPVARWRRIALVGTCAIGISPAVLNPAWSANPRRPREVFQRIVRAHVKVPPPGHFFQLREPGPDLTTFVTNSGLVLHVPTGQLGRCWDAPLPCTHNPAPNLRLRDPSRVERGFVVDGPWQMRDWPEPWNPTLLPALRSTWDRGRR